MTGRRDRRRPRGDRAGGGGGRSRLRRLRGLVSPARAGGLLGMLAAGLVFRLVTGPTAFGLERVQQPDLRWTSSDAVVAAAAVPLGANAFGIATGPIEAALVRLPTIAAAHVSVTLPGTLVISVDERQPILAWRVGDTRFLVDDQGVLFAVADADAISAANLPVVTDGRANSPSVLFIGDRLDPVDLEVARRLGSLAPADIGTAGSRLTVRVDDTNGYTIRAAGERWTAVFGFYSAALRSTDMIPGQVQLLRSLLAGREDAIDQVILASATTGTYTLRETPNP